MTAEPRNWRVGIIGMSPAGLYLFERLSLRPDISLVGIFEQDRRRREFAGNFGGQYWDQPLTVLTSADVDVVFLVDRVSAELISAGISHGKQIVISRPWLLSSDDLHRLALEAGAASGLTTVACPRRWSADFLGAVAAKNTDRLGTLQSLRMTCCEMSLPPDDSSIGVLREFGFHWLDQLLLLAESTPVQVFAKRLTATGQAHEHGVCAMIEFASGCVAQIDLQSQSRLAHRTGWMLEGSTGSYRNNRLYTVSSDGEIIDEPLAVVAVPVEPFIDELVSAWRGESSNLAKLIDAARVVELIELIERSATSGEVIRL